MTKPKPKINDLLPPKKTTKSPQTDKERALLARKLAKKLEENLNDKITGLKALGPVGTSVKPGLCRYVYGDPKGPRNSWAMCGREAKINSPWCEHHFKVVFLPKQDKREISLRKIGYR